MQNLLTLWANLTLARRAVIVGATLAMFLAVLGLARLAGQTNMALLYSGLDPAAAGQVVAALDQQGVQSEVLAMGCATLRSQKRLCPTCWNGLA